MTKEVDLYRATVSISSGEDTIRPTLMNQFGVGPYVAATLLITAGDNPERFFGSLKHDWIFKIEQPTREHMRKGVAAYMRYYNLERW